MIGGAQHKVVLDESWFRAYYDGVACGLNFLSVRFLLLGFLFLAACAPSQSQVATAISQTQAAAATPTPVYSQAFKDQVLEVIKEGTTLNAMTDQGVNYGDFQSQLAKTKGAYDLAESSWPAGFNPVAKRDLKKAFVGWRLALDLWNGKINESDEPVEPDINGYVTLLAYEGTAAIQDTHPDDYIVEGYRRKTFLPFSDNISVLLSLAGKSFELPRILLLASFK